VALALSQKKLKLHGWVYDIERGSIEAIDGTSNNFVLLATNREVHAT
jgi:carbonic anhydrase